MTAVRVRNLSKAYRRYARPWHFAWELLTGRPKGRTSGPSATCRSTFPAGKSSA